ncbi:MULTISPECIES: recombinase family protein [unclassified Leptolyngbya]|uniref:recombinase family protein n=1 Tax=unclassified Leptolyngbya TaxID=2650499 RepID=UPI001682F8B4|nr:MULTISPECIES: recombinase family protein [unclassified Leptolyngbya]MBD1910511.1 recombinase family protein [Leptolyngbya sp. FACHB-8]MBD2153882.1 recombinase family protein [Leptolyngbya sp. FACHB-16]
MKVVAYLNFDPLLEDSATQVDWGQPVAQIYQDWSSHDPGAQSPRLQWLQLLQDHETEPVQQVLVRRWSDLGESVAEVGDRLQALTERGITPVSLAPDEAEQPVNNPQLWLLWQGLQAEQRSRRIRQGHARNRLKALPPPGKAPYGYRRGRDRYLLDRTTAPVVKDFFEHFLLYGSLRGSVRYLQQKYNKRISVSTGKRWLINPIYRGDLAYQNGDVIADTHAPLISRQEAAQIERLLRRNRSLPSRSASASRSLAGLVTCATCGSAMTTTRVSAPRRAQVYEYLRPVQCTQQPRCSALAYGDVLERTIQRVCEALPPAVAALQGPGGPPSGASIKAQLEQQIQEKQAVLTQLPELLKTGVLDTETTELRAYHLRTEMAALQNRLDQLPPENLMAIAQVVSIPQFWQDLSEAERRFYFREFIRQIRLKRQDNQWDVEINFLF